MHQIFPAVLAPMFRSASTLLTAEFELLADCVSSRNALGDVLRQRLKHDWNRGLSCNQRIQRRIRRPIRLGR